MTIRHIEAGRATYITGDIKDALSMARLLDRLAKENAGD